MERDFGRLDILINNAGVMLDDENKKVSEQSLDTWRKTFDTNVFGLIATTQAFLPLLRKSEAGRIVNLSSILGSITFHATPGSPVYDNKSCRAYNVSKSAVNAFTVQLAYELKDTKIKVNAAHPGWVKTEMGGAGARWNSPTVQRPVWLSQQSVETDRTVPTFIWERPFPGKDRRMISSLENKTRRRPRLVRTLTDAICRWMRSTHSCRRRRSASRLLFENDRGSR